MLVFGVQHIHIRIQYEMFTTINLVNNYHHTQLQFFFLDKNF